MKDSNKKLEEEFEGKIQRRRIRSEKNLKKNLKFEKEFEIEV
jgi:hypothetical protein